MIAGNPRSHDARLWRDYSPESVASQKFMTTAGSISAASLLPPHGHLVSWCSRRDSNPDLRFRRPLFYPLNYGSACWSGARLEDRAIGLDFCASKRSPRTGPNGQDQRSCTVGVASRRSRQFPFPSKLKQAPPIENVMEIVICLLTNRRN